MRRRRKTLKNSGNDDALTFGFKYAFGRAPSPAEKADYETALAERDRLGLQDCRPIYVRLCRENGRKAPQPLPDAPPKSSGPKAGAPVETPQRCTPSGEPIPVGETRPIGRAQPAAPLGAAVAEDAPLSPGRAPAGGPQRNGGADDDDAMDDGLAEKLLRIHVSDPGAAWRLSDGAMAAKLGTAAGVVTYWRSRHMHKNPFAQRASARAKLAEDELQDTLGLRQAILRARATG